MLIGTAGYMSPEQVRGEPVDHRTDIFSFGATLYEMVSGARAFKGDTVIETLHAILNHDPPELNVPDAPAAPGLARAIQHCLEKEPGQRFQSARDLAFALGQLTGTSTSPDPPTQSACTGTPRLRRAANAARDAAANASTLPTGDAGTPSNSRGHSAGKRAFPERRPRARRVDALW